MDLIGSPWKLGVAKKDNLARSQIVQDQTCLDLRQLMSTVDNNCIKYILTFLGMVLVIKALVIDVILVRQYNYSALRQKILSDFWKNLLLES